MILRRLKGFEADLQSAIEYYVQFDLQLGLKLLASVKEAIGLLEYYPVGRPVSFIYEGVAIRKVRVNGFPYCLFYAYDKEGVIYLYAVMHERRDPVVIRRIIGGRRLG